MEKHSAFRETFRNCKFVSARTSVAIIIGIEKKRGGKKERSHDSHERVISSQRP